ncbi:MAG TPA: hypothetical protein VMT82_10590 [candidate division Zixibacteria bacterium]|nr:hypothetical protein [candidate division Zixibacteria bacterium]
MNVAIENDAAKQINAATAATHSHVCTLFEGGYHAGLAAFTNSLVASGFSGIIWVGYRGALPPWARGNRHVVAENVALEFIPLSTDIHLTNYKPQFMLDLIRSGKVDSGYLWYFDPDIVVTAPWLFFKQWSQFGIALIEDINNSRANDHPIRMMWRKCGSALECTETKSLDKYYNAGFIGVPTSAIEVLELWNRLIRFAAQSGASLKVFLPGGPTNPFYAPDQDAMNAMLMYANVPQSTMGPEAMGFFPGGYVMAHAIGRPKPWEGIRIVRALQGYAPSYAEKMFYRFCDGPIPVFSNPQKWMRRVDLLAASAIGRVYRRR